MTQTLARELYVRCHLAMSQLMKLPIVDLMYKIAWNPLTLVDSKYCLIQQLLSVVRNIKERTIHTTQTAPDDVYIEQYIVTGLSNIEGHSLKTLPQ